MWAHSVLLYCITNAVIFGKAQSLSLDPESSTHHRYNQLPFLCLLHGNSPETQELHQTLFSILSIFLVVLLPENPMLIDTLPDSLTMFMDLIFGTVPPC